MSDDENLFGRWSRLKHQSRTGRPLRQATEKKRGGAAPVAEPETVASLSPMAEPEPGATAAAPPPAFSEDVEGRELTPEEQAAVRDLPPIDSLDKDSDYTAFLGTNVPEFLKRQALKVLWRSDPVLANLDGLNDYDEDFSLAGLVEKVVTSARNAKRTGKGSRDAEAAEAPADDEELGDAEGDEDTIAASEEAGPEEAEDDQSESLGNDDVRPPDNAARVVRDRRGRG